MDKSVTGKIATLSEILKNKHVVTDTSSLLMAGTGLLSVVKGCKLIIPAIAVQELEEKRTHPTIGFLAREWLRLLEEIRVRHGKKLSEGVHLQEYDVTIRVEPNHSNQESLPKHLRNGSADSTILSVALNFKAEGTDVAILSNDVPMRLHATLDLDLEAYEFNSTQIIGAEAFHGKYEIVFTEEEYVDFVSQQMEGFADRVTEKLPQNHASNAYISVILKSGENVAEYLMIDGELENVKHKRKIGGITARTVEQSNAVSFLQAPSHEIPIVSLGGKAGSGKTLLAIANGIEQIKNEKYQKMIVFRSLHEMGVGQEMGFLPGSVEDKMEAWAGAIYDSIDVIAATSSNGSMPHKARVDQLRELVEVSPITYLRGRSLANTYLVLEEAQNFSRSEILNILSRVGDASKVVLTFDAAQVDNKFLKSGKDADIWSVIDSLKTESLFAHVTLNKTERSRVAELAAHILEK